MSRRRPSRALLFLGLCFVASAALRTGELGIAVAQTAEPGVNAPVPDPTAPAPVEPASAPPTLAERAAACAAPPGPLLTAIRDRVAELEAREARLAERESMLDATRARVEAEIAKLEKAESALARTLSLADGAAERDVEHLVGVYSSMKPKEAARVFAEMDPNFAAGFLSRMQPNAAAGILSAMEAGDAYAVTVIMAGRHVDAGRGVEARP